MSDKKVYVTRIMREEGINLLKEHFPNLEIWLEDRACPREIILQKAAECDALLTQMGDKIDAEVLANHPNLKVVSQIAVGLDNIDLKTATENHIVVSHTPGVLTEACADHAWALMLSAARLIVPSYKYVIEGKWTQQDPMAFLGKDIYGCTLGVIGPGRIGQAVCRRASGFSMKVLYHGPHEKPELNKTGAKYVPLEQLLKESDYVVLTCPLTPSTKHLIGYDQLKLMKKDAILVNIARGPVVVTSDLERALKEGLLGAAALDVTDPEPIPADHPILKLPNCLVVSHIASATIQTRATMSLIAAQAIIDALDGKHVKYCANPDVYNK
ncbi:hypothetical protein M9Y10_017448 [Tritrichomonas musculus]|uniref:Glyoxylate reductase/hydroxypyruvate reductase n=1 Tax=Tritrichomonas musculus TaxID=1915356 RepID=A0ABR2HTN7_9EUKA